MRFIKCIVQIITSTFFKLLINLFFATLLVIWLSHIFRVDKYLFLDRTAATYSTHLSVSLLLETTNLFTWVSQSTLQIYIIPLSPILFSLMSILSTSFEAYCFMSWQIYIQWLSDKFLPWRSMSPVNAYNLKLSVRSKFPFCFLSVGWFF